MPQITQQIVNLCKNGNISYGISTTHTVIAEWRYLQNEVQLSCFNIPIVMLPRFEIQVAKIFDKSVR